ncbi:MAG: hypothetical protein O7A08_02210 [SAR324 cluster bacterium]|nr:hypothetical protein [SAR324 cluster bacterium]MCZ6626966.1 hypothetical protein [SAR324 cluster bacterium]MCZ6647274.1 hypothetical protein [SAR324 cluster bacterium]MCZ6729538.1 hypothetical protein [SAR324 cluster bacterium]MCZ6842833.1 hypothetical protein [SAR324 cluster bacterium]
MKRFITILTLCGMLTALPALVPAVSEPIFVTLTIRGPNGLILSKEVSLDSLQKFLASISTPAYDATSVLLSTEPGTSASLNLADAKLTAYNSSRAEVPVVTFTLQVGDPEEKRYIVGAYIASSASGLKGTYVASTSLAAVFQ